MQKQKDVRIKQKLKSGFLRVAILAAIVGVVGIAAMLIIANRYDHALTYYGFSQGDIGKAMTVFAESRSSLRGAIGYDDEEAIAGQVALHEEAKEKFERYMANVEKKMVTQAGKDSYNAILTELEGYWELDEEIMTQGAVIDAEAEKKAQERAINELTPQYDKIYAALLALMDVNVTKGDELEGQLQLLGFILAAVIILCSISAVSISMKLGNGIATDIETPLHALSDRLKLFAQGDLDSPFPECKNKDEIYEMAEDARGMAENLTVIISDVNELLGEMAHGNYAVDTKIEDKYVGKFAELLEAIHTMNNQMNETLQQVENVSNQVSAGSENLAEASQALAEGATEQASSIDGLTSTITSITDGVEQTAKNLDLSNQRARRYAEQADTSRTEMETLSNAMVRINETSQKIGQIISDIEDIASQTNLLSLNAAIEAARAGEAGKGFAVVADQIRQLAEQSAKSAVDTRQLIEDALQEIESGNQAAVQASAALEEVVNGIKEIADSSIQLSRQSSEQAKAMEAAKSEVNQIAEVVQSNSASAQECSATSQELSAQAVNLNGLVEQFVLRS